jgi:hypothetical protein
MPLSPTPRPLTLKPDLEDANCRWQAFYAGDLIDRPVICVTAPRQGPRPATTRGYHDKVFGDTDDVIDNALAHAEATFWGGEAIPAFFPSFGPDEIATFCGAELRWSDDSPDTNWSLPLIEDWERQLPLRLQLDHPLLQRLLALCRRAADRLAGKMLISPLDLHTNLDLLAALRGPQRLCLDLLDHPELIDRAMADARAIFPELWEMIAQAARMDEQGYCHVFYAMDGAAVLQCDFAFMIGPEMFRRWVLPALEEEASIVRHALYHWDGPGALVHTADLVASRGLHALSYVPGAGRGAHIDYLDLLKRVQAGGKAVQVYGTPQEIQFMHRELDPRLVLYCTSTETPSEAEQLLDWFVQHT